MEKELEQFRQEVERLRAGRKRGWLAEIAPGSTGTIAVVADLSAFDFKKGAEKLVLQLFRADGLMVASVTLEEMPARK